MRGKGPKLPPCSTTVISCYQSAVHGAESGSVKLREGVVTIEKACFYKCLAGFRVFQGGGVWLWQLHDV